MVIHLIKIVLLIEALNYSCEKFPFEGNTLIGSSMREGLNAPFYREMRGVWISTVDNIDFPKRRGSEEEQKELIDKYLEKLQKNNFNAVFFQVKPDAGVIYRSKINPTTRYFLGSNSESEKDSYPFSTDMLEYIVEEAHKRNIEVHAWFNPYRMSLTYKKSETYEKQFSKKNFIRQYIKVAKPILWGDKLYLDPGQPISNKYVVDSIIEVVEKYDIDGIHCDDYFYQYPANGKTHFDWPDDDSAKAYGKDYDIKNMDFDEYGTKGRFAWRRHNINNLINQIYTEIKRRKPYVKWTVSPSPAWRNINDTPNLYKGSEYGSDTRAGCPNFGCLHADVLLWLLNGEKTEALKKATDLDGIGKMYVDAVIPQIYFTNQNKLVPFNLMCDWWSREAGRAKEGKVADIYIGQPLYRMGGNSTLEPWDKPETISDQVKHIRTNPEFNKGSLLFTMHNFFSEDKDTKGLGEKAVNYLRENEYFYPAIVPKMNTMKNLDSNIEKPTNPQLIRKGEYIEISFTDPSEGKFDERYPGSILPGNSAYYAIYRKDKSEGSILLIDKVRRTDFSANARVVYADKSADLSHEYVYYVTALDRIHNESEYLAIE